MTELDDHGNKGVALRAMFRSVDAGNWDALRAFYTHDCRYERPGFEPIVGLDALIGFYSGSRPIRSGVHGLNLIIVHGGVVSTAGTFHGSLKNGSPISLEFMDYYIFRGDLIERRKTFFFTPLA